MKSITVYQTHAGVAKTQSNIRLYNLSVLAAVSCDSDGAIRSVPTAMLFSDSTVKLSNVSAERGASVATSIVGTTRLVLCDGIHSSARAGLGVTSCEALTLVQSETE